MRVLGLRGIIIVKSHQLPKLTFAVTSRSAAAVPLKRDDFAVTGALLFVHES
jgi:hypothetical protein